MQSLQVSSFTSLTILVIAAFKSLCTNSKFWVISGSIRPLKGRSATRRTSRIWRTRRTWRTRHVVLRTAWHGVRRPRLAFYAPAQRLCAGVRGCRGCSVRPGPWRLRVGGWWTPCRRCAPAHLRSPSVN